MCGGGGGLITYNKPILKFQDFQLRNHFANMSDYSVFNSISQYIKLLSTPSVSVYFEGKWPNSSRKGKRVKDRRLAGFDFRPSHLLCMLSRPLAY